MRHYPFAESLKNSINSLNTDVKGHRPKVNNRSQCLAQRQYSKMDASKHSKYFHLPKDIREERVKYGEEFFFIPPFRSLWIPLFPEHTHIYTPQYTASFTTKTETVPCCCRGGSATLAKPRGQLLSCASTSHTNTHTHQYSSIVAESTPLPALCGFMFPPCFSKETTLKNSFLAFSLQFNTCTF